jgi:hypothetical protein
LRFGGILVFSASCDTNSGTPWWKLCPAYIRWPTTILVSSKIRENSHQIGGGVTKRKLVIEMP